MRVFSQVLARGACIASLLFAGSAVVQAKTPGKTYCFNKICHRVKTIEETAREVGRNRVVVASFYDDARRDRFNPSNLTSSGAIFDASRPDNAASPIYPDGTKLLVWSPDTRKTLVVRVTNAGPYHGKRTLDLSRGAAETLGFRRRGVARLHVRVLQAPTPAEARYQRQRRYAAVPGFVGIFDSIDAALGTVGHALATLLVTPAIAATPHASSSRDAQARSHSRLAAAHRRTRTASRGHRHARRVAAKRGSHRIARASQKMHRHRAHASLHRRGLHKPTSHHVGQGRHKQRTTRTRNARR